MCYYVAINKRKDRLMTHLKIAYSIGGIGFFVLWGFLIFGLFDQNWPMSTAFAAVICAINTSRSK
jgi:hypothetical protein